MRKLAPILATLCLVIAFVGTGLHVCSMDKTTETFSRLFSTATLSPFTHEQLEEAAIATQDYTVGAHDLDATMAVIKEINEESKTPYAYVSIDALKTAPDKYTLTLSAISHLDDCYVVLSGAKWLTIFCLCLALACLIYTGARCGRRTFGLVLVLAGAIDLVALLAIAIWCVIDFNGFFSWMHSLFFDGDSWLFSSSSLLICMYPTNFWIAMAALLVLTTVVCSLISIGIGKLCRRKGREPRASRRLRKTTPETYEDDYDEY